MSKIPQDLRYSKDHEWVRVEGDKAFVGITDHAQEALGEIVYVELPSLDEHFDQGEEISNVESVKAASAIINPIGGDVVAINEVLDASPELVNEDCYEHYLFALGSFDKTEYDALMDSKDYASYIKSL
ncbi:glycine cleavage system protein GcvH [uncultured Sphaerochaeta sp.]|uniref:glycine cleavage system protein GcvH n=1 Tax=uncultured Sphaerochaeta sp. TaxID=886478 RepID=UPI002A0A3D04|nr:glycine cleavage system protein GcvH [uncultured Sphaerochaeta sp.]